MAKTKKYVAKAHPCYGIIIDGVCHEVDEFSMEQVKQICDEIDRMAEKDPKLLECTYNAEGDDDAEYLCELLDKEYKGNLTIRNIFADNKDEAKTEAVAMA